MPFSLIPTHVCGSIYDIDCAALARRGVRLVLADLDNTLARYGEETPAPELRVWLEELRRAGLDLFVLSNSRKSRRCPDFCAALEVPYLRHAGKPRARGFYAAMERMGVGREETVMVGDQLYTDGLGANNAGVEVFLVRPIAFGNPLRALRYAAELPFRAIGARRERRDHGREIRSGGEQ